MQPARFFVRRDACCVDVGDAAVTVQLEGIDGIGYL